MRLKFTLGLAFLAIGFVLLSNAFSGLTGYVVVEVVNKTFSSVLALAFILGGIVLMAIGTLSTRQFIPVRESPLVRKIHNIIPRKDDEDCEVLVDTDFYVHADQKQIRADFFGGYRHFVTESALKEMQRRSGKTNAPLIPRERINFLTSENQLNTKTLKSEIPPDKYSLYKNKIINYWENFSPPGTANSIQRKENFKKSADLDMLIYAIHRGKNYTLILTDNYSEIGRIANALREREGVNVKVLTSKEVFQA